VDAETNPGFDFLLTPKKNVIEGARGKTGTNFVFYWGFGKKVRNITRGQKKGAGGDFFFFDWRGKIDFFFISKTFFQRRKKTLPLKFYLWHFLNFSFLGKKKTKKFGEKGFG